jgi:hypothetical protein
MYRNEEMFPNEDTVSHDLTVDDTSLTLKETAEIFQKRAEAATDSKQREALLEYAKLYREIAELTDLSDAEELGEF